MRFKLNRPSFQSIFTVAVLSILVAGCAPSVQVRTDSDPGVNLSQFKTYDFFSTDGN